MSARKTNRPKRPYHAFPWSDRAKRIALELATPITNQAGRVGAPVPYRTIAADLFARGLVDHKPDAATVRRLVDRMRRGVNS